METALLRLDEKVLNSQPNQPAQPPKLFSPTAHRAGLWKVRPYGKSTFVYARDFGNSLFELGKDIANTYAETRTLMDRYRGQWDRLPVKRGTSSLEGFRA